MDYLRSIELKGLKSKLLHGKQTVSFFPSLRFEEPYPDIVKMAFMKNLLNPDWWMFQWRYLRGQTPWDTQLTPPEVTEFVANKKPGKVLDLGCGTGTNAIFFARNGWEAVGVDFSSKAIHTAKKKAKQVGLRVDFYTADVTELDVLKEPFDCILDIGCLFTLNKEKREKYARTLGRLLLPKGCYMLYAWLPRPWKGKTWGMAPNDVDDLLISEFTKIKVVIGEESGFGSAWYWYERK